MSNSTELETANVKRDADVIDPFAGIDFSELDRSLRRPRTFIDFFLSGLVALMTILALIPLFSVVWKLVSRGGSQAQPGGAHDAAPGASGARRRIR